MEMTNFFIIGGTIVVILMLWSIVGVRHLKNLKKNVDVHWENVDEKLRKRHDLIPNLIETFRSYNQNQEALIENLIKERLNAAKEYGVSAKKIEYEHDLSRSINEIFALGSQIADLAKDTNFLELKREFDEIEREMEAIAKNYNEVVRVYNGHMMIIFLRPITSIFHFKKLNIFEVEI